MTKQDINKELFMQFVSRMYDLHSKIEIMVYGDEFNEEESEVLAKEFAGIVDGNVREATWENSRWFKVDQPYQTFSVWHNNSNDGKYAKKEEETA